MMLFGVFGFCFEAIYWRLAAAAAAASLELHGLDILAVVGRKHIADTRGEDYVAFERG